MKQKNKPSNQNLNHFVDLHVHPNIDKHSFEKYIVAMNQNNVDATAFIGLDESLKDKVISKAKNYSLNIFVDDAGIKLPDSNKIIFFGREYNTKEDIHITTVGFDDGLEELVNLKDFFKSALEKYASLNNYSNTKEAVSDFNKHVHVSLDHEFVDNGSSWTAGHIDSFKEAVISDFCLENNGDLTLSRNGLCRPDLRKTLKYFLNIFREEKIIYHDVNNVSEKFSALLKSNKDVKVPVVEVSDIKMRTANSPYQIGASGFWTRYNEENTPMQVLSQIKNNFFKGGCERKQGYVSIPHFVMNFGIPIIMEKSFNKNNSIQH